MSPAPELATYDLGRLSPTELADSTEETLLRMIAGSLSGLEPSNRAFHDRESALTALHDRSASAEDVHSLYRLFLGREPESLAAIEANEGCPLSVLISNLLGSDEHRIEREKLVSGGAVGNDRFVGKPDEGLTDWVAANLPVSEETRALLPAVQSWWELLAALLPDPVFTEVIPDRLRSDCMELAAALRYRPAEPEGIEGASVNDVRYLYRMFLGREPEFAAIEANKGRRVRDLVETLLGSDEFRVERDKLILGGVVAEDRFLGSPDRELRERAAAVLPLTEVGRTLLADVRSWREILVSVLTDPVFTSHINERLHSGLRQLTSALQGRQADLREPDDAGSLSGDGSNADGARRLVPVSDDEGAGAMEAPAWFDEATYLELHPGVAAAVATGSLSSGYQHYALYGHREGRVLAPSRTTRERAKARLRLYSPASSERYLQRHPDVKAVGADPFDHYLRFGWQEGRKVQSLPLLAQAVGRIAKESGFDLPEGEAAPGASVVGRRIGVYVSSQGNLFMNKIAHDLVASLNSEGAEVSLLDEHSDPDARPETSIFVAPHEFFLTGDGKSWVRDDIVSEAIMLNTEQVQTVWYEQSLPYLLMGRAVIDMYYHSARLLADSSVPTTHWTPDPDVRLLELEADDASHPLFRTLADAPDPGNGAELRTRPIAVNFFGAESEKRDLNLARLSGALARHRAFICFRRFSAEPLNSKKGGETLVRLGSHVAARSRITLNLLRDDFGAFESFGIVRFG